MNCKQWNIVHTKPKMERKVSEILAKKKIENFYLLNRIITSSGDKSKISFQLLFPRTVFVSTAEAEQSSVRKVEGVLNYLHWLDKPVTIKNEDISVLKNYLLENPNIQLEKIPVNIYGAVEIKTNSAVLKNSDVLEVEKEFSKLYIPSLGYALHTRIRSEETISNYYFSNLKKLNSAV